MSGEYLEPEEEFVTRRDANGELYVTNVPAAQTPEQIELIERVRMAAPRSSSSGRTA